MNFHWIKSTSKQDDTSIFDLVNKFNTYRRLIADPVIYSAGDPSKAPASPPWALIWCKHEKRGGKILSWFLFLLVILLYINLIYFEWSLINYWQVQTVQHLKYIDFTKLSNVALLIIDPQCAKLTSLVTFGKVSKFKHLSSNYYYMGASQWFWNIPF